MGMFYSLLSHIKFWLTATNQHGVHSPFVYRFVTKCLYHPRHYKTSKSIGIPLRTLAYFTVKKVQLITDNREIENQLSINGISISDTPTTFIYLDSLNETTIEKYVTGNLRATNDTIIYIPQIYRDVKRNKLWQTLVELEVVQVSLDMYYGGLLFFKREQAKEHFKIRV
ncbi:hypothetical protein KCTC52924_02499 [Arenibacter antarcticus]|uniref:Uncharacterized protein n=1 Tax=Arenibacter antarcticus TaxID=2040469 RepID=A0ABW5VM32_9FLAO|nr:hypothetical protein [Arenibacter sp. H213]MCM4168805.1 hypothetical protein [Arenibacter sp. H213]